MNLLTTVAWLSLGIAFVSAATIVVDEITHPQKMWVMNIVWPMTALYLSIFALYGYFRIGRGMTKKKMAKRNDEDKKEQAHRTQRDPTFVQVAISDSHCGAGCVLGDIFAEYGVFALGLSILGSSLYASYVVDYVVAWTLGILFQYFVLKPMKDLSTGRAIIEAIKADTLSITTFQIGMYGWMALVFFVLFPNPHLEPNDPAYWLMMQIAMICGFVTSLPMNWWLLKIGLKEVMG
ncbi:MAG TPA: DUF4396 domain-containing protein [Candidatus Acidoferrum sp.]